MKKKRIEQYVIDLNQQLGHGSFGKVFKGYDEVEKRAVAVKIMDKKLVDRDEYIKNALFLEIKILKKLHSPNVVRYYDVMQTNNNYYIFQQLCDYDLNSLIKREKKIPQAEARVYLQQICNGFIELINHGIIHRDLKPQNILVAEKVMKIADFGFAKHVLSQDQLNKSLVGTPYYMSPQQLRRQKYTPKCDIWAIGLIYYEMLFGRLPWKGQNQVELMSNIWNIKLQFKGQPKISDQSQDFIRNCLKIEEVDRLGWSDIYRHPIFKNRFQNFIEDQQKSNSRANYILTQLRFKIHGQNIDLEKLLKQYEKDSEVKVESFNEMLASIQPLLQPKQSKYLFDKFDSNHDGVIKTDELKKCLTSSSICLNSLDKHPQMAKHQEQRQVVSVQFEDEETRMWFRITEILDKLRMRLEKKNYDLYQVYSKYDFNKDKLLDIYQFKKLMDKIQTGLTEQETQLCFRRFDLNNDKFISFQEFYRTLCKINGVPSYVGKFAEP